MAKLYSEPKVFRLTQPEIEAANKYQKALGHRNFSEAIRFALRSEFERTGYWPPKRQVKK